VTAATGSGRGRRERITLLVNVWLGHAPVGLARFPAPRKAAAGATRPSSARAAVLGAAASAGAPVEALASLVLAADGAGSAAAARGAAPALRRLRVPFGAATGAEHVAEFPLPLEEIRARASSERGATIEIRLSARARARVGPGSGEAGEEEEDEDEAASGGEAPAPTRGKKVPQRAGARATANFRRK
jgi:hypothetical protein